MKTTKINARIEQEIKEQAEKILHDLGLNASHAIRAFYKQIILNNGLPFELKIPNTETLRAMQDAETGDNVISSNNIEEMLEELHSKCTK